MEVEKYYAADFILPRSGIGILVRNVNEKLSSSEEDK